MARWHNGNCPGPGDLWETGYDEPESPDPEDYEVRDLCEEWVEDRAADFYEVIDGESGEAWSDHPTEKEALAEAERIAESHGLQLQVRRVSPVAVVGYREEWSGPGVYRYPEPKP